MTLAAALREFCGEEFAVSSEDHPGTDWSRLGACVDSLHKRREEAAGIEEISRQTLPLLEEIRDHLDDQSRVNRLIGRIDGLRARMNELGPCYDLVLQLTQQTQMKRFEADRRLSAAKVEGMERQRRQVQRDVDNVKGMIEAAGQFQALMDETAAALTAPVPELRTASKLQEAA